jgi:ATP-dependent Clp protease ATP-binding subunit ClpA
MFLITDCIIIPIIKNNGWYMSTISELYDCFNSSFFSSPRKEECSIGKTIAMIMLSQLPALGIYLWKCSENQEIISNMHSENESHGRQIQGLKEKIVAFEEKKTSDLQKALEKMRENSAKLTETLQTQSTPKEISFSIGVNLNEKYRNKPAITSLKGRETEFEMLKVAIGKSETPNVLLVGPSGSGKTTLVEAWADEIARNEDPNYPFKDTVIISISASDIISGSSYVGVQEARVNKLIAYGQKNPNIIFFIDELHSLMRDGSSSSNGIPNMLKKALSDGHIRIIGCTTNQEFEIIEKDAAFTRRFSVVDFKPPTKEMIREIIQTKVQNKYSKHHNVIYSDAVIAEALKITEFLPGNEPAKTLALLDTTGSLARIRGLRSVTLDLLTECAKKT